MIRGQEGPDPRDLFRLLWRRKWILLLCVTLIPAVAYLYTDRLEKTYEATTVLQFEATAAEQSLEGVGDFAAPSAAYPERIAALIETSGVADAASRELGEPEGSVRGSARATADEDTGFITIFATASSGERAAKVANAFAEAVRATREEQGIKRVDEAAARLRKDLAKVRRGNVARRQQISEQLQRLGALRAVQDENVQVLEPAEAPSAPASPNPKRNAILALVLALLIGGGLVVLVDRMDRALRKPEELEGLTGAPLLVTLSATAFPGSAPDPGVPLAFQALRDSLTYFNVDESLPRLIVTSPLKGDGKTTVAANLAVSFARAGRRVVAVDGDLRNPRLAGRLGVDGARGLTDVLMGAMPEDVLQEVESFGPMLRVLPGGAIPPNPSELLGSVRMASLLARLEETADVVVIDTPPLLVVSDAFGLLGEVSGTVGVAKLDVTPRDAVARMAEIIRTAGGRLLGMIAAGARPGEQYGYYGYGEAATASTPAQQAVLEQPIGTRNGTAPESVTELPGRPAGEGAPPAEAPSEGAIRRLFRSG